MCSTYVHSTYVLHDQLYNNSRVEVFACWESVNKNIIIASYNERHIAETYTVDTGPDLLGENLLFLNDFLFWSRPATKSPVCLRITFLTQSKKSPQHFLCNVLYKKSDDEESHVIYFVNKRMMRWNSKEKDNRGLCINVQFYQIIESTFVAA